MKRTKKCGIIIFILLIFLFGFNCVLGAENISSIEKSAEFEKWENLSEQERKNTIQPSFSNVKIQDSIKKSTYNNLLRGTLGTTLGESYDLRETQNIIVKNQQQTGSCWAFSYSSIVESTIQKLLARNLEISPMHLDYKSGQIFNRVIGEGGNGSIALAYSASGYGPVLESDLQFNSVYDEANNNQDSYYLTDISEVDLSSSPKFIVKDATTFASIYKSYSDDTVTYKDSGSLFGGNRYTEEQVNAIRNLIKKHIKEDGAVSTVLAANGFFGGLISTYYNEENNAYYVHNSMSTVNHAVTIVGWDDTYSKNNFNEGHRPVNDGAYIVLNSWGTEFGENGYFYVSYDDVAIEQEMYGINSIQDIEDYTINNLYEYDELGMSVWISLVNDERTQYLDNAYLANVYERQNSVDKYEYLSEIGIFLASADGVEVYVNPDGDDLNNCDLVATYTGANALDAGYHTLELASPVLLTGNKFVVKVKYINSEITKIPLECNLYESGFTTIEDNLYSIAQSNEGESYISKDGTNWSDLTNYDLDGDGRYVLKNTNACIQAFTMYSNTIIEIPVTGVDLDKTNEAINVGETVSLTATVKPENATNKNVIWESDDEGIATVENGVVTGISEGITTITVTTENGGFTNTCTVTVNINEEPENIIQVEGIELNKNEATIKIGETLALIATVKPENATNKNIVWESNNEEIATVENGVVIGIAEGTTEISVITEDGEFIDVCEINVVKNENIVYVESISLNKQKEEIQVGDTFNLVVSFNPTNASNKNVRWESSNTNVATITNKGIITGIAQGKTIIKAISEDGNKEATCELTVVPKTNTEDDIYKDKENPEEISNKVDKNASNAITKDTDNTTSKEELPNAGARITFIAIIGMLIFATIKFIKYRKLKEIK